MLSLLLAESAPIMALALSEHEVRMIMASVHFLTTSRKELHCGRSRLR